jgi:predicted nucleotide-binding protein (sugar kinase/HSP70/actin superfamily)
MIADDGEPVAASFVRWAASNRVLQRLQTVRADSCAGVIQMSCFNCGCDSMMTEIFRETLAKKRIPYMALVLDEHAASAGLDTRLEAFVDSLMWRS